MQLALVLGTLGFYAAGCAAGLIFVSGRWRVAATFYRLFVVVGFLAHTGLGILLWQTSGQFPVTQPADSVWLLVWFMVLAILVTDYVYGLPTLAPFLLAGVVLLAVMGLFLNRPSSFQAAAWTPLHVIATVLGFCGFAVAATSSILYLVQERALKSKLRDGFPERLPSLETLDRLNFHTLLFGFILLTLGLGIGIAAAVGTSGLGPDWWLDPKVLLSVVVWLFYGAVMSCRLVRSLSGRPIARLTILGFALVMLVLVGGDRLLPGVHAKLGERVETGQSGSSTPTN